MILVTGAAGKTGQAVIQALVNRGADVRAFIYHAEQTELVKQLGAKELIIGNMLHETTFKQAMYDVQAVYHICANMNPQEIEIGQNAIQAAQWANVARFVFHSVLHPQTEAMPHHWHKLRVEEQLFEAGLPVTILQPSAYMQNITAYWETILQEGVYRVPYPVTTRLSQVDLTEVAEVAAIVLTEAGHIGATYELAGPPLTPTEMTNLISEVIGRPVEAAQLSLEVWMKQATASGLGKYQVETLVKMFQYYEQYHFIGNSNVLGWLLQRPPTTFREFVERFV